MRFLWTMAAILCAVEAQAQTDDALEIIGYQYHCKVQIGDPSRSEKPSLYGFSKLTETGVRKDFMAHYSPGWSAMDQTYFLGQRPSHMGKDATHVRWSLDWRKYDNRWVPEGLTIGFEDASLNLDFNSWHALPQSVVMLAGQGDSELLHLGSPLFAFSDRWPGRKTGAGFGFPLAQILAVSTGKAELHWAVYKGPLTRHMPYTHRRGQGSLDLDSVRSVSTEFEKFHSELARNEADFKNKCTREPVYDDPNSQI